MDSDWQVVQEELAMSSFQRRRENHLYGSSRRKGWLVSSLKRLCLEKVIQNMKPGWVNYMADVHIQELIQLMSWRNRLAPGVLHSFLVPRLTELNLSVCHNLVDKTVAQTIAVQCKNLTSLNLRGCNQIPTEALVDLIKGLPHLTKLDLSKTECDTEVLLAVGSSCHQLCELDISCCRKLTPYSLFYLAYDDNTCSFCCPNLERLNVTGLYSRINNQDLIWSLVFVLLVLPNLKVLIHDLLLEALCLIHSKRFDRTQMPCEYSPLIQLAWCRTFTHTRKGRITLALQEMHGVCASYLPVICALCPQLAELSVVQPVSQDFSQSLLSCSCLTHLTIDCSEMSDRGLRELFLVTATLGPQLQSLSVRCVAFEDELSFPTLLSHCPNLHKFSASFISPERQEHGRQQNAQGANWDFTLTPLKFPRLSDFSLEYHLTKHSLPSRHQQILTECLVSVLKHSPFLQTLTLVRLPVAVDEVFEKVLATPGTALLHLSKVSVTGYRVPAHTIRRFLSSENQLNYFHSSCRLRFGQTDYSETFWRA